MASNANFISQFVMGGDPCTYKESGELQAEMSKLTHPARPDVDWRQWKNSASRCSGKMAWNYRRWSVTYWR